MEPETPHALFSFTNNNCTVICSLAFTNNSLNADTYKWNFGDGSFSTAENPDHFYGLSGMYQVTLTASKDGVSDSDTQMVEIKRPESSYNFGSTLNESATAFVQTSDGGYVITGNKMAGDGSLNVYLIKVDASRHLVWEKAFGSSGDQAANAIKQTNDGGFIIAGYTKSGDETTSDVYLIKLNAEGFLLWKKTFDNANQGDVGTDLVLEDDGYILTGRTKMDASRLYSDILLMKTDLQGNMLWQKSMGSTYFDSGNAIIRSSDGHFVVAGAYNTGPGVQQPYLIKFNTDGTIIWEQYLTDDQLATINSLQETSEGGFILGGITNFGGYRGIIAKTNSNGELEWSKKFTDHGVLLNSIESIAVASDGGYIVCGEEDRSGYDFPVRRHVMVIKTDAEGNQQWIHDYALGGRNGNAFDIQQTLDGGYALAGFMLIEPVYPTLDIPISRYDNDVYFLKIDQSGNLQ